jgi:hypothetical protein
VLGDPLNSIDPEGLVDIPPIGPVSEPQCATYFIQFVSTLGVSLQEYFNSEVGILGLTMFFEQQGRLAVNEATWIGIGWTFINRYRLSDERKMDMGFSRGSFINVIQQPIVGSHIWSGNNLLPGFQSQFLTILRGSPADSRCLGLAEALRTALRVLVTANGVPYFNPAPNNVGPALIFSSGSPPGVNPTWDLVLVAQHGAFRFWTAVRRIFESPELGPNLPPRRGWPPSLPAVTQ